MPLNRHRRRLLQSLGIAVALPLLAAGTCSTSAFSSIAVTLEGGQAEAQAILAALTTYAGTMGSALPAAAAKALGGLSSAVTAFTGLTATSTPTQYATAVIGAVQAVLQYLPIPATTATAISFGLSLLSALVSGLPSITIPAASAAAPTVSAVPGRVVAPIPIPVS